jgi:hypothetical protein
VQATLGVPRQLVIRPVRRKNSVRRPGKGRLRDPWSDSADDDGLPAVVGADDMGAGVRHASTGG